MVWRMSSALLVETGFDNSYYAYELNPGAAHECKLAESVNQAENLPIPVTG